MSYSIQIQSEWGEMLYVSLTPPNVISSVTFIISILKNTFFPEIVVTAAWVRWEKLFFLSTPPSQTNRVKRSCTQIRMLQRFVLHSGTDFRWHSNRHIKTASLLQFCLCNNHNENIWCDGSLSVQSLCLDDALPLKCAIHRQKKETDTECEQCINKLFQQMFDWRDIWAVNHASVMVSFSPMSLFILTFHWEVSKKEAVNVEWPG